jgi:hypothetical protein
VRKHFCLFLPVTVLCHWSTCFVPDWDMVSNMSFYMPYLNISIPCALLHLSYDTVMVSRVSGQVICSRCRAPKRFPAFLCSRCAHHWWTHEEGRVMAQWMHV